MRRYSVPVLPSLAAALLLTALARPQAQTVALPAAKDNTLYAITNGSLSNGAGESFFAGLTAGGEVRRAVIAFDVSSIPAGSLITAVSLQLTMTISASAGGDVSLHRALADWGEGNSVATFGGGGGGAGGPAATGDATWLHRFYPNVFWTNQGGDYAATASAVQRITATGPYTWSTTPSLVADVQGWLDQPATNFGWLLRTPEALTDRAQRFASRENTVPADRPSLAVTFVAPGTAGFTPFGSGCAGTTGVPALAQDAGSLPLRGQTFRLALTGMPAASVALGVLGFSASLNNTALGTYALPFALLPFGMPGCTQYVSADGAFFLPAPAGQAIWPIAIPGAAAWSGFAFHVQGVVVDAGANALGATVTNAGTAVIGG